MMLCANKTLALRFCSPQLKARDQPVPPEAQNSYFKEPEDGQLTNCTIFLGYTSNLISSGLRETIRYLVQNRMVR